MTSKGRTSRIRWVIPCNWQTVCQRTRGDRQPLHNIQLSGTLLLGIWTKCAPSRAAGSRTCLENCASSPCSKLLCERNQSEWNAIPDLISIGRSPFDEYIIRPIWSAAYNSGREMEKLNNLRPNEIESLSTY